MQSGGSVLYLAGSIHVGTPELYPLPAGMVTAFQDAKMLVLELDLADAASPASQQLFMAKGMYPPDDYLNHHLSPEVQALLAKNVHRLGPLGPSHQQMKPWFLSSALAMQTLTAQGFQANLGVDQHFYDWAKERSLPIFALETVDSQSDVLANLSEESQQLMLKDTLLELSQAGAEMRELLSALRAGNPEKIDEILMETFRQQAFKPAFQALILDRNEKMKAVIENYLKTPEVEFVLVGAAHLVGEQGLVRALASADRQVSQL